MWPNGPDGQLTELFLLALALVGFVMKLIFLLMPGVAPTERLSMSWILPAPISVARSLPVENLNRILLRAVILFGAVSLSYWIYWELVRDFQIRGLPLSYLAAPLLLLMGEFLVAVATLFFLPGGRLLPALHRQPWLARSVADFWGARWNLWFSDWFRYILFSRFRRRPVFALLLVFVVSGFMHEWVINVPLFCVTGRVLFGSMMLYFLIQAAGVLLERRFLRKHTRIMILFAWLVVFVPCPLVLNEGLLRVLHLWPEHEIVTKRIVDVPTASEVLDHVTGEISSNPGIAATKELPGEGLKRILPPLIKMDASVRQKMDALLGAKL